MKINEIKKSLFAAIESVCRTPSDVVIDPERDFTRSRKLSLSAVVRCILSMDAKNLECELMDILGRSPDTATPSAFIQQRSKIRPEAFKSIMDEFNKRCRGFLKDEDLRILAVDGSDIQIPTNPDDTDTFFPGHKGQKAYNLLHLNAMYDLNNRVYTDAAFDRNEHAAFVKMVDGSRIPKALVIADRGYESFNDMAHVQEKGWFFLIRVKDGNRNCIKAGLDIPDDEEFDIPLELNITGKQTNKTKEMIKDCNRYHYVSHSKKFDYFHEQCGGNDPEEFYLLRFRAVRIRINDGLCETLLTNLPAERYAPEDLKRLYGSRWGIETSFRSLKYTTGLLHLHSKKVMCIKQEIFAKIIMYNFTEMVTSHVIIKSRKSGKYIYKANFTIATHMCKLFFRNNAASPEVEEIIAKKTVPIRPGRARPRDIRPTRTFICFCYRVA